MERLDPSDGDAEVAHEYDGARARRGFTEMQTRP